MQTQLTIKALNLAGVRGSENSGCAEKTPNTSIKVVHPQDLSESNLYENDALFKLEIRKKFREIINLGFNDIYRYLNDNKREYTFWDYQSGSWQKNNGMRIDHFLISSNFTNSIKTVNINKKPRSKIKPSDHTPIECEII